MLHRRRGEKGAAAQIEHAVSRARRGVPSDIRSITDDGLMISRLARLANIGGVTDRFADTSSSLVGLAERIASETQRNRATASQQQTYRGLCSSYNAAPFHARLMPRVRGTWTLRYDPPRSRRLRERTHMNSQQPYTGFSDVGFDSASFPDNPDPRAPCVLVMDVSGSMGGRPIAALNEGLRAYRDAVTADPLAARRVEIAIVTFGGSVDVVQPFVEVSQFNPPHLASTGDTPMATAVARAMLELESRKQAYRGAGVQFYRPWIFLFTDGGPTEGEEKWRVACEAVRRGEAEKKFTFYAVGVDGADFAKLAEISPNRPPLRLNGLAFQEFFKWLSASQRSVSQSQPGQAVALPPTTGPDGWATTVV
jgi:uncharacterized protein YegL